MTYPHKTPVGQAAIVNRTRIDRAIRLSGREVLQVVLVFAFVAPVILLLAPLVWQLMLSPQYQLLSIVGLDLDLPGTLLAQEMAHLWGLPPLATVDMSVWPAHSTDALTLVIVASTVNLGCVLAVTTVAVWLVLRSLTSAFNLMLWAIRPRLLRRAVAARSAEPNGPQ